MFISLIVGGYKLHDVQKVELQRTIYLFIYLFCPINLSVNVFVFLFEHPYRVLGDVC